MDSFSKFFSNRGPRHRGHGMTDTHHSLLTYIRDTFKIVPHKDRQQKLGKTGILLYYNPEMKGFMLKR